MKRSNLARKLIIAATPILLFAIVWQYRRPPFTLRAIYAGTQNIPVSPSEAAAGFDTRLSLKLRAEGEASPPRGYEYELAIASHPSLQLVYGSPPRPVPGSMSGQWIMDYSPAPVRDRTKIPIDIALKLAKIPASYGALYLQAQCAVEQHYKKPQQQFPPFLHIASPPITILVPVRAANKVIAPAKVSSESNMVLQQVLLDQNSFTDFNTTVTPTGNDVRLQVTFRSKKGSDDFAYLICKSAKIVDDQDNCYKNFNEDELIDVGEFREGKPANRSFLLPLSAIPATAGRLTFKAHLCAGDSWPVALSVVVREKGQATSDAVGAKKPIILRPDNPRLKLTPANAL